MAYIYNPYQRSNSVIDYEDKQKKTTSAYTNYANTGYKQGAGGYGNEIATATDRLNALYGQKPTQQFQYSNQQAYDQALDNVANQREFSYSLADDQLYQQAKDQYQMLGKTAMADTIGQASAMTGGYGNSYATTAGSQAYQGYLQQLNNNIGDYYNMALNAYNANSNRLNNILGAYSADRSQQQSEWAGNWDAYNSMYNQLYGQLSDARQLDMTGWQQQGNNLYNAANLATNQYGTASSNDIGIWESGEKMRAEQASLDEAYRQHLVSEQLEQQQLAESKRHNLASEAETKRANDLNYQYKEDSIAAKNGTSTKKSTKDDSKKVEGTNRTSNLIRDRLDPLIERTKYTKYNGDSTKAVSSEILPTVKDLYESGQITQAEANYLIQYYGLDRL